jgi:octaprenyl-diphosphate synthase
MGHSRKGQPSGPPFRSGCGGEACGIQSKWNIVGLHESCMSHPSTAARQRISESEDSGVHLGERLEEVQEQLQEEVRWVEQRLLEVSAEGPEPVSSAARHLVGLGGKRVRPAAVLLSAACFGRITDAVREVALTVELIHTATLLHDDVIDEGMERRGAPTARQVWGNAVSVLAGDSLLVSALDRVQRGCPEQLSDLLATLRRLVAGEVLQLRGRSALSFSEQTYERILLDKTASLFRFATGAGAAIAGASASQREAFSNFGERLGVAFQLVDDVLDYTSTSTGKTLGADLLEGKLTLPLVLAAQDHPEVLRGVEQIRSGDFEHVENLRRLVVSTGACERVQQRAGEEMRVALKQLQCVERSPARELLALVAQQVVSRTA